MKNMKVILISILLVALFSIGVANAMGEKYREQGQALSMAIDRELISRGLCKDFNDVKSKLLMYGGHGNHVNFSIYQPDRKVLAITFEFIVAHGLEVTGGVPISVSVYPKSREEYGNIIFSPNPTIQLEVKE